MNDEIKESINRIRNIVDFYKLNYKNNYDYSDDVLISMKILLDYITNLQEENEKLKELCNKYEEEDSSEFKIWKNERQQLRDYKSKNEEAIEYINKTQMPEGYKNELLNLLKGE